MAKNPLNKISRIKIESPVAETISGYELDIFAALVLNDTNAEMTIHADIEGLSPEPFNIKKYVGKHTLYLNGSNILDVANIENVSVSGTINAVNAKAEIANALRSQFPNLTININNSGSFIWFRDPIVYELLRYFLKKDFFILSDFNAANTMSFANSEIEYFNEYTIFSKVTITSFENCKKLKEIVFPSRITTPVSFTNCESLQKINLDQFTSFINNNFNGCVELLPCDLNENVKTIPNACFYKCGKFYISHIPSSVTSIEANAFFGTAISFTEIPQTVTTIGLYSFRSCLKLTKIIYNASTSEVPYYCFEGCTNLSEVEINGTSTTIASSAFNNTSIKKLKITAPIERINAYAFQRSPIEELDIDVDKLVYIGDSAFYAARELFTRKFIKIDADGKRYSDWRNIETAGANNIYIDTMPNADCDYLLVKDGYFLGFAASLRSTGYYNFRKIMYDGTIDEFLNTYSKSSIGQSPLMYAINNTTFEGFFTKENGQWKKLEGTLRIPENIPRLYGSYCFHNVRSITEVIAPQLIVSPGTFVNCYGITKFNAKINNVSYFPNLTTASESSLAYGSNAKAYFPVIETCGYGFVSQPGLVDIGDRVKTMTYSFGNNGSTIIIRASVPPSLNTAFSFTPKKIYVKPGTLSAYAAATNWWRYTDRIYEIGGAEWVAEFGSANEWADYPDGIEPFSNPNLINSWDDVD